MAHTTPPPMPEQQPSAPPPAPKRNRTNAIIIGSAAAVIATIVTTGVVVANSRDDGSSTSSTTAAETTPPDDTITAAEEPEPTPEDTGPEVVKLTDGMRWDGGIEVELSGWTRGVTGPYAAPENTPYVKFTMKIRNTGDETVDLSSSYVTCLYGDDGRESEQVFDSERGLEGMPQVHLRPGKSVSATTGCELPKGEKYLQVELAPTFDSETAIFAGNVK